MTRIERGATSLIATVRFVKPGVEGSFSPPSRAARLGPLRPTSLAHPEVAGHVDDPRREGRLQGCEVKIHRRSCPFGTLESAARGAHLVTLLITT